MKNFNGADKKIASELAIGIIIFLALLVGGIFWISENKQTADEYQKMVILEKQPKGEENKQSENSCESHYYEGESKIHGWVESSEADDEESIVVYVKDEDVEKLPIKNAEVEGTFTVRIIDPTEEVREDLIGSTEEKPAEFTVKGYAEICEQEPPQVSLKIATVAFKKS